MFQRLLHIIFLFSISIWNINKSSVQLYEELEAMWELVKKELTKIARAFSVKFSMSLRSSHTPRQLFQV